ncbi:MAG: hypothetical protein DRP63_05570 [Planctomycetota bacterium]|nr:MAG: hypothetical protein DRP63_05570 [Planctomycetota bacterium]
MRNGALLFCLLVGCVVNQTTTEKEQTLASGKWRPFVTREQFMRRYPGLPLKYMSKMRKVEEVVKEGESLEDDYQECDAEERHRKRKLLDTAVRTYMRAMNEGKKVYEETGCDAVMMFLSRTVVAALKRLLVEYEKWRRIPTQ